jgi:hypothetical protein
LNKEGSLNTSRRPVPVAAKTVTVGVTDTDLAIACDDGLRAVRRTTELPVRNVKASRPRKVVLK